MTNMVLDEATIKRNEAIKQVFKGNEQLAKSIRSLLLGMETTDEEKNQIKAVFSNEYFFNIFSTYINPTMTKDIPLGSAPDIWLDIETQIFDKPASTIKQSVERRKEAKKMLLKALELLKDPFSGQMECVTDFEPDDDPLQIGLLAREFYIKNVLGTIKAFYDIANQPEQKKNLQANSSK